MGRVRIKKKSKNLILRLAVFAFSIYVTVTLVQLQIDIGKKSQMKAKLDADISTQKVKNQELQRLLSSDNQAEYIERIAREKLGFADPQERIFIDASGN